MTRSIDTSDKYIDSRDVISRIEDLQQDKEWLEEAIEYAKEALETAEKDLNGSTGCADAAEDARQALETAENNLEEWLDSDDAIELQNLEALQDEAEGYCDWAHGETLIREDAFEDYAKELLEDIGALPKDIPDYIVIDWEATADNLAVDYIEVNFDDTAYLVRKS